MSEWLREALLEEQGYTICPLCWDNYCIEASEEKCRKCEKEYKKSLEVGND